MELLNFDNVMATLEQYAQDVRNLYQDKLIRSDRIASGQLLNSVEYRVVDNGLEYEVKLTLEDYWKYVEEGVMPEGKYNNPGWKAYPFIRDWISVKPVIPRPNDKGKIPTPKQLAFLITRKIKEKGTEGSHDLQESIEEINERYKEKIVYSLHQDLQVIMKVIVGEIKGEMPSRG